MDRNATTRRGIGAVAALTLVVASATAQIVPPPTEAAPPTKPYTAPSAENPQVGVPDRPQPGPQRPPPTKVELPNVPYESLVKRDADGKVIRLNQPATWAATRRNPILTKEDWARLEPIFAKRKAECESVAITNLDLVEKVDAGEPRTTGDAKQDIKNMRELFAPITLGKDFSSQLGDQQQITLVQSQFSQQILSEYNKAVTEELRAAAAPKTNPNAIQSFDAVKFLLAQRVDEALWCYRWLLDEASHSLDTTLPALNLPQEKLAAIADDRKALGGSPSEQERRAIMQRLMARLSLQERRDVLTKTVALRPKT